MTAIGDDTWFSDDAEQYETFDSPGSYRVAVWCGQVIDEEEQYWSPDAACCAYTVYCCNGNCSTIIYHIEGPGILYPMQEATFTAIYTGYESCLQWYINAEHAVEFDGTDTFVHSFTIPGTYTISVQACDGDNGGDHGIKVILPDGCSEAGPHDSSIHWIYDDNYEDYGLSSNQLGTHLPYPAHKDINFRYNDGSWVCEISDVNAKDVIRVKAHLSGYPNQVSVESASQVPCIDANCAKIDLFDDNLEDDKGAPCITYWSYNGAYSHEMTHRAMWEEEFGNRLTAAIANCEKNCFVPINPKFPETYTCQSAQNIWKDYINSIFNPLWQDATNALDNPNTPNFHENEVFPYYVQSTFTNPIANALPQGCRR